MALKLKDESEGMENKQPSSREVYSAPNSQTNYGDDLWEDDLSEEKEISFARDEDPYEEQMSEEEESKYILNLIFNRIFTISAAICLICWGFYAIGYLDSDSDQRKLSNYEAANGTVVETGDIYFETTLEDIKHKANMYYLTTWYQPVWVEVKKEDGSKAQYNVSVKLKTDVDEAYSRTIDHEEAKKKLGHTANEASPKYQVGTSMEVYIPAKDAKVIDIVKGYEKSAIDGTIESGNTVNEFLKKVAILTTVVAVLSLIVSQVTAKKSE